jgi:hypothetical protein
MRAFHSDAGVKQKYLERILDHRRREQLVQGYGFWTEGRGCAVGCTIHSSAHDRYEVELGIPTPLAHLEDTLFETLPEEHALDWPEKFLRAIPVGANLSNVIPHFFHWLLLDETAGVLQYAERYPKVLVEIQNIAALVAGWAAGNQIDQEDWIEARDNAKNWAAAAAAYGAASANALPAANAAYAAVAVADFAAHATAIADKAGDGAATADTAADRVTESTPAYAAVAAAYAAAAVADASAVVRKEAGYNARLRARMTQAEMLLELLSASSLPTESSKA